jgi:2-polyprenyl-3-methyl-5-hydroxy-6-metoxy-1,4-benzoquinol methylase
VRPSGDDLRREAYATPRPDVFELVPRAAMRILDAGCSNGALGESLRRASSGRSICGIEFDHRLAAEARQTLERVIQADLNQFDWSSSFSSERFDCIIFADVLVHPVDPWAVLQASTRFLLPAARSL